ncbi:unnamed protein product [Candidula unifasciata]|uniref:Uncharacterized protein n=1 Tax=Candidula unifasciata TaxID=100452 RepID=A0A8S3ZHC2_9EUPU|nr:unnamed protein product [Candidula unifasciata]
MSATGDPASASGVSRQDQGGQKPDPVTGLVPKVKKGGSLLIIDYYYDQEPEDDVNFELRPAAGRNGCEAVFSVARSSSSRSRNVLDVSKLIEEDVWKTLVVKKKKLKKTFFRVKLAKPKNLDLTQYFMIKSERLSSSDEDKK